MALPFMNKAKQAALDKMSGKGKGKAAKKAAPKKGAKPDMGALKAFAGKPPIGY